MKERIYKLYGKVQNYFWGGDDFIPHLLKLPKEENKQYAEYWMGAHPSASSLVEIDGEKVLLSSLIQRHPSTFIGDDVFIQFGELPYLFKVLDVKDMLSIQVHPTKEAAIQGFEAEEAANIPIEASFRNYKDRNHKPEVMVALSEFWLLHGFKQETELSKTLHDVPEFNFLSPLFKRDGYKGLYKEVMELPQEKVDETLAPLVERELLRRDKLSKNSAGYWVSKLYNEDEKIENIDRGIFSIYFFNIVQVHPGEAVFQGAGIPHAYLEGQNVELMANSDNVLRGGLTSKHIDVQELIKHTMFKGVKPNVMKGEIISEVEKNYPCPVADFSISSINLNKGTQYSNESFSAEIYLVVDGAICINDSQHRYEKGEAFFVLPNTRVSFQTDNKAALYKAFIPPLK